MNWRSLIRSLLALLRPPAKPPLTFEEVCRAEVLFYAQTLKPGMVAIDVGAHRGELTLLFARCVGTCGRVLALEPSANSFGILEQILQLNGRKNICCRQVAAGNRNGIEVLRGRADRPTLHSLVARPVHDQGDAVTEQVQVVTLDALLREEGISQVDLLKIDVEGHELAVLLGAVELFRDRKVGCCVFEFGETSRDAGQTLSDYASFFDDCGYTLKNLTPDTPLPKPGQFPFSMLVATPKSRS